MSMTLGISSISETTCDRKLYLYIKSREKKIFPCSDENKYMIIGKVLHSIFQQSLKYYYVVQYYYHREKKSVEESILQVFNMLDEKWQKILLQRVKDGFLFKGDFNEIIVEIKNQLPILAKLSCTLISETDNRLELSVIDDEFNVSYNILPGILLTGKVDLVCYDCTNKTVRLIELKTGKPSPKSHNRQLRLYGEIFRQNFTEINDVRLELWNSKSGDPEKGFAKIKKLRNYDYSELDNFKTTLKEALNCTTISDLPDEINFPKAKEFCLNCHFCDLATEIFSNGKEEHEEQSRLDSYFG